MRPRPIFVREEGNPNSLVDTRDRAKEGLKHRSPREEDKPRTPVPDLIFVHGINKLNEKPTIGDVTIETSPVIKDQSRLRRVIMAAEGIGSP